MRLCKLNASDFGNFFGSPQNPIVRNATIIGQTQDCSSFLILTTEIETYLVDNPPLVDYIFTYCQSWGLTITPEVVNRVWADLRKRAYPEIGDQLDGLFKKGLMPPALSAAIQAVKDKYPKMV